MKNANSKTFVDPSRHQLPLSPDIAYGLLTLLRRIALIHLQQLTASLFDNLDSALFDLAERAENNASQNEYFDGLREVREKRALVERAFQDHLGEVFDDFDAGRLQRNSNEPSHGTTELTLIDDAELDEALAISSIVSKAENRLAAQLIASNQRLFTIRDGTKVDDTNNPVAPACVCAAFRKSMHIFSLDRRTRLITYKMFDRYVMAGLDALYAELDGQLVYAGVLPTMRRDTLGYQDAPQSPSVPTAIVAGNSSNPAVDEMTDTYTTSARNYSPATRSFQAGIYDTVCTLLADRHGVAVAEEQVLARYPEAALRVAPKDLLSALSQLQYQAMTTRTQASTGIDLAQVMKHLKQELLARTGMIHGINKTRIANIDEDTIDLVEMLFEFILQDRNLLPQMQALFSRLQIPFLKVALLNRHLFAQKSHPARRLLDSMAQGCIGWSEETDPGLRLLGKVKATIESLLKDFDEDLSAFDRTRIDFESFLEANKKRADLAEQRAVEVTRGRERLNAARCIAAAQIRKCTEAKQLPSVIHNVLTRPWANYLVLMLLRYGESSVECQQALRFANQFAWSGLAKSNGAQIKRLRDMLPGLEKSLRHSLAVVAYHDDDVTQVMRELHELYTGILQGGSSAAVPHASSLLVSQAANTQRPAQPSKAAATAAAVESAVAQIIKRAAAEQSLPTIDHPQDHFSKRASEMKVGEWVEFTSSGTDIQKRAKLSWISPITLRYLFVDRRGLRVSDTTVAALAAEMRQGLAQILEEVPLFDRALDAIVERLKVARVSRPAEASTQPA